VTELITREQRIQSYALDLVADGAESTIEDDIDEDGALDSEEDHAAAYGLAMSIVRAIRAQPDAILALARLTQDEETPDDGGERDTER
jgi:hypothetical protein